MGLKTTLPHLTDIPDSETKRMPFARIRCRILGHMWILKHHDPASGETMLECFRCWPHIDSQQTVITYDPAAAFQPARN